VINDDNSIEDIKGAIFCLSIDIEALAD